MSVYIYPPTVATVDTGGLATEAKQDTQITELQGINTELNTQTTELQSINTELDTQTIELQSINAELDTQTGHLASIAAEDFATETTLAAVAAIDFATEAKQDTQITELQSVNTELDTQTGHLASIAAEDFATETTLAAIAAIDFATEAKQDTQITELQSINTELDTQTGHLSSISSGTAKLSVVDQIDTTPLLDVSSTNIPASASLPQELVASTAAIVRKLVVVEDIGEFLGIYTGAAASEVLLCVMPLGGGEMEVNIPASTRVSIRHMKNSAITSGFLSINFLG